MDEIESLCRLCEAVETAGADIAPTNLRILQVRYFLIGLASREKEEKEYQCKSTR